MYHTSPFYSATGLFSSLEFVSAFVCLGKFIEVAEGAWGVFIKKGMVEAMTTGVESCREWDT